MLVDLSTGTDKTSQVPRPTCFWTSQVILSGMKPFPQISPSFNDVFEVVLEECKFDWVTIFGERWSGRAGADTVRERQRAPVC